MTERYSPTEAKLALARTAELQVARERSTVGVTREELQRIAGDTGLDVDLLDQALGELEDSRVQSHLQSRLLATVVRCELLRPLSDDERTELSSRLAHERGESGRWEELPSGRVWRSPSLRLELRSTARGDLLRVTARKRWPVLAMALGVPAAAGALALAVRALYSWKLGIESIAVAVFLGALVLGWFLVFVLDGQRSRAAGERLRALLEQTVRPLPAAPSTPSPPRALPE
ncbi:hypothetical protein [Paraliomyxa miuraensis]|uniref:hypothetical protein n=1 Tax=Paraliomyxa miuraensis TaxID=376150 RepID=UPI002258862C|nr:hypothetical protein [Paraliomyxa miuraensis]MCX4246111.1 hypothetical protein [Paraliomyxa miuraensis]